MKHGKTINIKIEKKTENMTYFLKEGSLDKLIKKALDAKKTLSEEKVFDFTLYLVDGLKYLHENKILHRDIKPK